MHIYDTRISVVCATAPCNSTALKTHFNSNSKPILTERAIFKFHLMLMGFTQFFPVDISLQHNYIFSDDY